MRKHIFILALAMLMAGCLSGCSSSAGDNGDKKLEIVATIFPEYDWVNAVLGDKKDSAEVTMLLDNGVDLHSYQPTADDIIKISDCDMFIYVGGESDEWVEEALAQTVNKDMVVINLMDTLGDKVKEEEVKEGMEHDHEHEHGDSHDEHEESHEHEDEHEHEDDHEEEHEHEHEHGEEHEHEHEETEYDEHVWLSLKNAATLCDAISDGLCRIDETNADIYRTNADNYKAELSKLDEGYESAVSQSAIKTVLFGDRFPFRYMTDDYGLDYYAAFVGCSAETEASFETITYLAGKTDELDLPVILTIEGSDHKIAETIRDNTAYKDQQILTMNSMQSVTKEDVEEGASYISIMKDNLEVLKEALK